MLSLFVFPGSTLRNWFAVGAISPRRASGKRRLHAKQSRGRHEQLFANRGRGFAMPVCDSPKIAGRTRTSCCPGMAVFGGQNDAVPAHSHEGAMAIGDVLQAIIRSRITGGPPDAFSGSNNRARITHGYKNFIAVSDAAQAIVGSGILAGPRNPIRGSHD